MPFSSLPTFSYDVRALAIILDPWVVAASDEREIHAFIAIVFLLHGSLSLWVKPILIGGLVKTEPT